MDIKNKIVAVFVDAENLNQKNTLKVVVKKAKEYGSVSHRLVYGNNGKLEQLKEFLWKEAAIGIPVFRPIEGKKIADAVMLVSITQHLYEYPDIDVFVIASADSDFVVLTTLLRNKGKTVVVIGNNQSIAVYRHSCHDFFSIEKLLTPDDKKQQPKSKPVPLSHQGQYTKEELLKDTDLTKTLHSVYSSKQDKTGWTNLSHLGATLGPGFQKRYGFKTISLLLKETGLFLVAQNTEFRPKPESVFPPTPTKITILPPKEKDPKTLQIEKLQKEYIELEKILQINQKDIQYFFYQSGLERLILEVSETAQDLTWLKECNEITHFRSKKSFSSDEIVELLFNAKRKSIKLLDYSLSLQGSKKKQYYEIRLDKNFRLVVKLEKGDKTFLGYENGKVKFRLPKTEKELLDKTTTPRIQLVETETQQEIKTAESIPVPLDFVRIYTKEELLKETGLIEALYSVYSSKKDYTDWAYLSFIGEELGAGFHKKYGFKTIILLLKKTGLFHAHTKKNKNKFRPRENKISTPLVKKKASKLPPCKHTQKETLIEEATILSIQTIYDGQKDITGWAPVFPLTNLLGTEFYEKHGFSHLPDFLNQSNLFEVSEDNNHFRLVKTEQRNITNIVKLPARTASPQKVDHT